MTTTMVTNSECISSIKFRTKFEKLVTDENRPVLITTFKNFLSYDPDSDDALNILWRLTYNDDIIISTLYQTLGLSLDIISTENISKLRDELRYQYERHHGDYLLTKVHQNFSTEFNNLVKYAGNICATVVITKCVEYHEKSFNPVRVLYLLESDFENNYYGGLRELGFDQDEAQFLKHYHKEIYNLYKAIGEAVSTRDHCQNTDTIENFPKDDDQPLPFVFEEVAKESIEINSNYRRVIAENILMNRDVFTAFIHNDDFNLLPEIFNFGFDLNEVMAKKEKIRDFIYAIEEKEEADAKLFEAHSNLNF